MCQRSLFYDKKLEAKKLKEQEIEKIEQELKDYMSKAEYKSKKEALKEKKMQSKKRLKNILTIYKIKP